MRYKAGDEVSITIVFLHPANIGSVTAYFFPEQGDYNIELSDEETNVLDRGDGMKQYEVVLSGEITGDHTPGGYRLVNVVADTAGGRRVGADEVPSVNFEVVEEESGAIQVITADLFKPE